MVVKLAQGSINKLRIWPLNEAAVTQTKKHKDMSFFIN